MYMFVSSCWVCAFITIVNNINQLNDIYFIIAH